MTTCVCTMHKTFQEPPFGSALHLLIPSRRLEGNLSEKISSLKQMTVKSLGGPDALNPGLVIGSLLIHLSCLVLINLLVNSLSSFSPTSCCCPFLFLSGIMGTRRPSTGRDGSAEETQAPHALPADTRTVEGIAHSNSCCFDHLPGSQIFRT